MVHRQLHDKRQNGEGEGRSCRQRHDRSVPHARGYQITERRRRDPVDEV